MHGYTPHIPVHLEYIGSHNTVSGQPMVISTGMQSMETIHCVYKIVKEHKQNFTLLQCTSTYPLDPKEANLSVIKLGKSVIAKVAISKGTVLRLDMFAVKVGEPKGIPPENMQNLVGKKIKVDMNKDDSILADVIE
ncbi:unnamed protein product [Oreochromis niloticus]|nr:unnamed protein product [Mustela putorius furo]